MGKREEKSSIALKEQIRKNISHISDYIEIVVSAVIIFVVILFAINLVGDIFNIAKEMFIHNVYVLSFEELLSSFFEIIIGIELVKMLSNHSHLTTLKLLLFVTARSILANHSSSIEILLGVISIAVIFAVRKFLMPFPSLRQYKKDNNKKD